MWFLKAYMILNINNLYLICIISYPSLLFFLCFLSYQYSKCRMFLSADYNEKKSAENISSHLLSSLWTPYNRLYLNSFDLTSYENIVMGETCECWRSLRLLEVAWSIKKNERRRRHRCNRCLYLSILKGRNLISFFWLVFLIPSLLRTRNLVLITYWS